MNRIFCSLAIALVPLASCVKISETPPGSEVPQDTLTKPELAIPSTPNPTPTQTATEPPTAVAEPPAAPAAHLVIPGEQVGLIQQNTDRQALAAIFGDDQLIDEEIAIGEGFYEPGTRVNLGDGRSLTVIWTDNTRSRPLEIRNLDSQWQTPEGIHIGQSVSDLEAAIGEFQFYGFAWDYGGTVLMESSKLAHYQGLLFLRLRPTNDAFLYNGENAIVGDILYPSDHPDLETLDAIVNDMIVVLNPSSEN